MKNSTILWCDHTWNVATGCTKISEECKFCYMFRNSLEGARYNPAEVTISSDETLQMPYKKAFRAKKLLNGSRPLVFTCSQTDLFHEKLDEIRPKIWETMKHNRDLIFLVLTKRPERIMENLPVDWNGGYENVWLGTSVGLQKNTDKVDALLRVPSAHYFLSCEPLLEGLDLSAFLRSGGRENPSGNNYLDWAIVGGESGYVSGKYSFRECKLEWIESIVEQCIDADTPVFVKQMGTFIGFDVKEDKHGIDLSRFPDTVQFREFPIFEDVQKEIVKPSDSVGISRSVEMPIDNFWDADGRIDNAMLLEFLSSRGIGLYYPSKDQNSTPILIQESDSVVSIITEQYIKRFVKNYISEKSREDGSYNRVLNSLIKSNVLKLNYFHFLENRTVNFVEDTRNHVHFFFRNGVVRVSADRVELLPYDSVTGSVWQSDIIQKDIRINDFIQFRDAEFYEFLSDLAFCENPNYQPERIDSLQTMIGYLLSRFKDPSLTKAIILMDTKVNGLANGGSGKSLLASAIGRMREMASIDGKMFDARRAFNFDAVKASTKAILFDDVDKGFDFEKLFPLITTGIRSEKKHKDSVYIPYDSSPKVILTTNYAIAGASESFMRRVAEFEVSHVYNSRNNPEMKFGHLFFEDWNDEEYNKFYNVY